MSHLWYSFYLFFSRVNPFFSLHPFLGCNFVLHSSNCPSASLRQGKASDPNKCSNAIKGRSPLVRIESSQPSLAADGLCERVHPEGRSDISAAGSPVHLEHEDKYIPGRGSEPERPWDTHSTPARPKPVNMGVSESHNLVSPCSRHRGAAGADGGGDHHLSVRSGSGLLPKRVWLLQQDHQRLGHYQVRTRSFCCPSLRILYITAAIFLSQRNILDWHPTFSILRDSKSGSITVNM